MLARLMTVRFGDMRGVGATDLYSRCVASPGSDVERQRQLIDALAEIRAVNDCQERLEEERVANVTWHWDSTLSYLYGLFEYSHT